MRNWCLGLVFAAFAGILFFGSQRKVACQQPCAEPGRLTGSDASVASGSYKILFDTDVSNFTPEEKTAMTLGLGYWPTVGAGTNSFSVTFDPNATADHTIWIFKDASLPVGKAAMAYNNQSTHKPGNIGVNASMMGSNQKGANFWKWDLAHEWGHELGFGHTPGWTGQPGSYGNSVMDDPLPNSEADMPTFPAPGTGNRLPCDEKAFVAVYSTLDPDGIDESESTESRYSSIGEGYTCWIDTTITEVYRGVWDDEAQDWTWQLWYTIVTVGEPYGCYYDYQ